MNKVTICTSSWGYKSCTSLGSKWKTCSCTQFAMANANETLNCSFPYSLRYLDSPKIFVSKLLWSSVASNLSRWEAYAPWWLMSMSINVLSWSSVKFKDLILQETISFNISMGNGVGVWTERTRNERIVKYRYREM